MVSLGEGEDEGDSGVRGVQVEMFDFFGDSFGVEGEEGGKFTEEEDFRFADFGADGAGHGSDYSCIIGMVKVTVPIIAV